MDFNLNKLNKVFDNRIRVGIMSALVMNEEISFKDLKDFLDLTDGNWKRKFYQFYSKSKIKYGFGNEFCDTKSCYKSTFS